MMFSTGKASLVRTAKAEADVSFAAALEVSSPGELKEDASRMLAQEDARARAAGAITLATGEASVPQFKKPSRPGRRRRK